MAKAVPLDVATYLEDVGLGVLGESIFVGPKRPVSEHVPADAVFVNSELTARPSQRVHSGLREIRFAPIQVRVRASHFEAGYERAMNVMDALYRVVIPGYIDTRPLQSEPIYLQQDENGNYEWSLNFEVKYETEV